MYGEIEKREKGPLLPYQAASLTQKKSVTYSGNVLKEGVDSGAVAGSGA